MANNEPTEEIFEQKINLTLWRRIFGQMRPYWRQMVGLIVSGLIVAAIDALLPRVTGLVIDTAIEKGAGPELQRYCLYYFGLVSTMAFLIWLFIVFGGQLATGYAYDIRRAAFSRLQELSFSYFDKRPVGWLMARLTSDTERVSNVIPWFLLDLAWGLSLIIGIAVMMFLLNPTLAAYVILIMPPLVIVSIIFQRRLLESQRAVRKVNSQITAGFNESIMGVRTTKTLVREEANLGEFQVLSTDMRKYSVRNSLQAAAYLPIVITLGSAGVGLALWRGGLQVPGDMTMGVMVAFMQYAAFFYIPIQELASRFTELQAAQASAERLQGLLDTVPEISDSDDVLKAIAAAGTDEGLAGDGFENHIQQIAFENVSFSYLEGEPVLSEFNLTVTAGETIALVGATGSGKSTIVNLLSRFYEPTSGSITINGRDYRERGLHWLQSNLGIVLQSPHLFSGSILENIRYGRLDATDDEVFDAARLVNAHTFILQQEDGYATDVGEGGNRLSTGQKQLVSLARAVLADPQIFIMDEATSSVDTETERLIQDGIDRLLTGRISFIIAHRLSTVRSASRILVIGKGRIIESGSHEELIRAKGEYYRLYANQFTREGQQRVLAGEDE
jgi:ATP-binding cassette, subfamily B, bacterial